MPILSQRHAMRQNCGARMVELSSVHTEELSHAGRSAPHSDMRAKLVSMIMAGHFEDS